MSDNPWLSLSFCFSNFNEPHQHEIFLHLFAKEQGDNYEER